MSLVEKLSKKPEPPSYAEKLKNFQTSAVAKHLEISPSWLALILQGTRPPGKRLEQKLINLVKEIEAEESR